MTPQELRALARKCRKWAKSATDPDNIALFRIWATDLADEANEIEHGTEYWPHYRHRAGPRSFAVPDEPLAPIPEERWPIPSRTSVRR